MGKNQWFRMYSETATDPKIQMMSESDQRRWMMLLCLRCGNDDVTFQDADLAFQLRVSLDDWLTTKALFITKCLINSDNKVLAWNKRQYVSDLSTSRVKKHRDKLKQVGNVSVTPPDTDTDTDTEKKGGNKTARFAPPSIEEVTQYFVERGCTNPHEPIKFVNFYESKGWVVGKTKMKVWKASASNWVLKNKSDGPPLEPLSRAERAARDAIA